MNQTQQVEAVFLFDSVNRELLIKNHLLYAVSLCADCMFLIRFMANCAA